MNKLAKFFSKVLPKKATRSQQVDLAGSNNIFGSIATSGFPFGTNMDFIPSGANGETVSLTGGNIDVKARWLGLSGKVMQYWAYNYCSPLATVIDRIAEADTNGIIRFKEDEDDIPMKKSKIRKIPYLARIYKILNNPNPIQTKDEFNSQQLVYCKVFGYCPVLCISPAGLDKTYTKYMFNLNPYYCNPVYNNNYDIFAENGSKNTNPILEWNISIFGKKYTIPASDILLIRDGYMDKIDNTGLPLSKVAGLDYFISNICAAMEADNVLLKKKGPLGVFSHDAKSDMAGIVPMTPEAQDDLQEQLRKYGLTLGQLQYVVSRNPIKWNAMSFNLRDLMTKETVKQGIDGICDRFGYPAELMAGKNATYDNKDAVEKQLYQNNIIPFSLRRMARYNEFFGLNETDYSVYMCYKHLAILKEDVVKASSAREAYSNSIQIDWEGGRMTWNECRDLQELERVDGMDIYYPEYIEKYPNMVRGAKEGNATKKTKYDRKITKPASEDTGTEE